MAPSDRFLVEQLQRAMAGLVVRDVVVAMPVNTVPVAAPGVSLFGTADGAGRSGSAFASVATVVSAGPLRALRPLPSVFASPAQPAMPSAAIATTNARRLLTMTDLRP
jgi:hypothetical protein